MVALRVDPVAQLAGGVANLDGCIGITNGGQIDLELSILHNFASEEKGGAALARRGRRLGNNSIAGGQLNQSGGEFAIIALEVLCSELELQVEGFTSTDTDGEGDLSTCGLENVHGVLAFGDLIDVEVVIDGGGALQFRHQVCESLQIIGGGRILNHGGLGLGLIVVLLVVVVNLRRLVLRDFRLWLRGLRGSMWLVWDVAVVAAV